MRDDLAAADRRFEVREAARGWQRAGAIDEATRAKIDAAYPDDRSRLGEIFRVLVFGFTLVVLLSALGILGLMVASAGDKAAFLFFLCGIGLAALTEAQIGAFRRRQGGTEAATAFLAVLLVIGASLWLYYQGLRPRDELAINAALVLAVVVLGAAGYRWGYALFVGLATVAAFVLLARAPFGRLLCAIVPLALTPFVLRASDSSDLAPSHRRSCEAIAVVALVFVYLAVHLASWDLGILEVLTGHWREASGAPRPFRPFFAVATALVPVLTLAWGIRSRRRLLINLGLVGLLASIVTLRVYVHVAPLWLALIVGGGAAIGLALLLQRYLDSGAGRERGGFTAEPVFTEPEGRSALELAASAASFAPAPRPVQQPGFQGGGGRSGGGGATGNY